MNHQTTVADSDIAVTYREKNEVIQFILDVDPHPDHAIHVSKLALLLFDQTIPLHQCGVKERKLLEYAAYLHDIGLTICTQKHHKHSQQLILNTDFSTITQGEKEIVANIARYHRKAFPKQKHNEFAFLTQDDQQIVRKMSALLRIAEGLDRTHSMKILDLSCTLLPHECLVSFSNEGDCFEEKAAVFKKKDLFRDVYGMEFNVVSSCTIHE